MKKSGGHKIVLPPARPAPRRTNQPRGQQIRREPMQPAQQPYMEPQQTGQNGWYQYNSQDYENPGMYQYPVQQEYQDPYYQPQEEYSQQQEVYSQQESGYTSQQEYSGSSVPYTEDDSQNTQMSDQASGGASDTGEGYSEDSVSDESVDDEDAASSSS